MSRRSFDQTSFARASSDYARSHSQARLLASYGKRQLFVMYEATFVRVRQSDNKLRTRKTAIRLSYPYKIA
jgi:hypothetical protein